MITYKTINGVTYKLLDIPEPLTLDTKMPCLVERWSDDDFETYMKIYISDLIGEILVVTGIKDGVVVCQDELWNICELPYIYFKVVGYPVVYRSSEWAWWQMTLGNKVCATLTNVEWYAIKDGNNECSPYNSEGKEYSISLRRSYKEFIDYSHRIGCNDWKLYEPKLNFADIKVGDWVEISESYHNTILHHRKVTSYSETSNAYPRKTIVCGEFEFTIDGEAYDCPSEDNRHPSYSITRVLSPSEVVINIGHLSGTVARSIHPDTHFYLRSIDGDFYSEIAFEMLDKDTRLIVESLLSFING